MRNFRNIQSLQESTLARGDKGFSINFSKTINQGIFVAH